MLGVAAAKWAEGNRVSSAVLRDEGITVPAADGTHAKVPFGASGQGASKVQSLVSTTHGGVKGSGAVGAYFGVGDDADESVPVEEHQKGFA